MSPRTTSYSVIAAWGAHLLTSTGILAGFAALLAAEARNWRQAFAWLVVALIIDGVDGTFARRARVNEVLPWISGEILDFVIDFVTYVLVPTFILYHSGTLPEGLRWVAAILILLSSLFLFCRTDLKTEDFYFRGFPALWNFVAFYIVLCDMAPTLNFLIIIALTLLTFAPIKVVHPFRVNRLRWLNIAAIVIWAASAGCLLWSYPERNLTALSLSLLSLAVLGGVGFLRPASAGRGESRTLEM